MSRALATLAIAVAIAAGSGAARADGGPEMSASACTGGGCYLALDDSFRDAGADYARLMRQPKPKYLRTTLELATALGVGTAWYWIDRDRQVADWDFPSLKQRFTFEAWRFDNNPFDINWFWHTFNGTGFHVLARSNRLGLAQSAAFGFATSMVWEYALEFREKVSVNDVISTTGAGVSVGEFLHWLGRYLGSAPRGTKRGWKWSLAFWHTLHARLDGDLVSEAPRDNLGLSSHIWHRFQLSNAYALHQVDDDLRADENIDFRAHELSFDGRLVAIPGYLRPGQFARTFFQGNVTSMNLAVALGNGGFGVDMRTDTMLVGHHRQSIPTEDAGGPGHALTIGANLGYHYRRQALDDWVDRFAVVHLPGLAVDGHVVGHRWRLTGWARLHADFGGMNAAAYRAWDAANPDVVDKTILTKHRYYYAFGGSARLGLSLHTPRVSAGASTYLGWYDSKEGLDRKQEEVVFDVTAADRYREHRAWLRVAPTGGRLFVGARLLHHYRHNRVDTIETAKTLTRYSLELGAVF